MMTIRTKRAAKLNLGRETLKSLTSKQLEVAAAAKGAFIYPSTGPLC